MMTATARKRHTWTQDELKKLNAAVKVTKNNSAAFDQIAGEMKLSKSTVASQYYAQKKTSGPKRPVITGKAASFKRPMAPSSPNLSLAGVPEADLIELANEIQHEIARRTKALGEVAKIFTR